jgi:hypothetical protein
MEPQPIIPRIHARITIPDTSEDYTIDTAKLGMQALRSLEVLGKTRIKALMEGLEDPSATSIIAFVWWARFLAGKHESLEQTEQSIPSISGVMVQRVDDDDVDPTTSGTPESSEPATSEYSPTSSD